MIIEAMKDHRPFDIAIMIGWYSGLRISETFGLTWNDINFDRNTITVNKQIVKRNFGVDVRKAFKEKGKKKSVPHGIFNPQNSDQQPDYRRIR